jgi:Peptidase family M23
VPFKLLLALALLLGALAVGAGASPTQRTTGPATFPFYPQAGIPWRDLYFGNFVDLDPGPGVLDWNCGSQTYDTHSGEDSIIRSFREKRIGVPVFAAIDGTVVDVSDLLPDEHTADTMTPVDNHVIVSSRNREIHTVYGHLRKGVLVRVGQHVVPGQQLGWTASSGHSTWPHLHFTARLGLDPYEPFAGPCRQGPSYWAAQPAMPTEPYVRDFTFSTQPFGGRKDPPWDEAVRTGTFVQGLRDLYFRVELAFFSGGTMHVTVVRPDGKTALDAEQPIELQGYRATWADLHERLALDAAGRWRIQLAARGKTLVDAPFDVVATQRAVRDRPPNPISVRLETPSAVPQCVVQTSLVTEDSDFQIMRYRYRWFIGKKRVRAVTSAGLSDVLRQGLARPGQTLTCKVTPSDGKLSGPTASAAVRLR